MDEFTWQDYKIPTLTLPAGWEWTGTNNNSGGVQMVKWSLASLSTLMPTAIFDSLLHTKIVNRY